MTVLKIFNSLFHKPKQNSYSDSEWLEAVKAIAILWILWYHIDQLILPENYLFILGKIADFGFSGVHVFLLLSGFGLSYSLSYNKEVLKNHRYFHTFPWQRFFVKRLLRIYPLFTTLSFFCFWFFCW